MGTMRTMGPLLTWIIFLHFIFEITGSTHWVVTENGRIQAQGDSAFDLRRPDDFMAFLAQEERFNMLNKLTTELADRKDAMANRWDGLETHSELEGRLRVQDEDCKKGVPLADCDLYASTYITLSEGPKLKNKTSDKLPECVPLNFSLHLFEHLHSMRYRANISMPTEVLLLHSDMNLFGRQLAATITYNQSDWHLFNLATGFWRARGDAPRAIECVRWALHFSPTPVRHIALVHLGNILHQAKRSAEAAIVLHAAVDHAPRDAISHWTLGNVYTVLGDYNRAAACLENALNLDPSLHEIKKTRHSVLCHAKVGQALSELKDTLQGLLHDLEHCQEMRQQRLRLQQMILRERAHPLDSILGEHVRAELDASMLRLDNSLQHLLSAVQTMVQQLNIQKKKLTNVEKSSQTQDLTDATNSVTEWPSAEECQLLSRHPINIALLFIPPENKGYVVRRYLGEMIGLSQSEHPLPWHPPLCSEKVGDPDVSPAALIKLRQLLPPSKPIKLKSDTDLMGRLLSYVDRTTSLEEEFGQRILTALNKGVGPKWLLLSLAGLYWRAQGQLQPATQCLVQALHLAPDHLLDLPLVALSSLLASQGYNAEALALALQALQKNSAEVATNLLMASLLLSEGNFSGARLHMMQAMKSKPIAHLGNLTRKLACQVQSAGQRQGEVCKEESSGGQCKVPPPPTALHCMQTSSGDEQEVAGLRSELEKLLALRLDEGKTGELLLAVGDPLILAGGGDDVAVLQSEVSRLLSLAVGEHIEEGSGDEGELVLADPESLEWHLRMDKEQSGKSSNYLSFTSNDPANNAGELSWSLSREECKQAGQQEDWSRYMVGVSTREIELSSQLPPLPIYGIDELGEPTCTEDTSHPVLDKLEGVRKRHQLPPYPEPGLGHGLRLLAAAGTGQSVKDVGTRIALALDKNSTSWVLTTAAALYWRVVGHAGNAVTCLRQAVRHAPQDVRDIPLLSLANVFQRAGLLDDAAMVAKMAIEAAPKFVVTHFTLANILASKGELGKAMVFYQSSLGVQPNFEPARHRLKAILCSLLYPDEQITISLQP